MLRIETEPRTGVDKAFQCANCSRNIAPRDPNVSNLIIFKENSKNYTRKVSVLEAVSKIFKVNSLFLTAAESDLTVCYLCGGYISELYRLLECFAGLSVFHSKIAELLRRPRLNYDPIFPNIQHVEPVLPVMEATIGFSSEVEVHTETPENITASKTPENANESDSGDGNESGSTPEEDGKTIILARRTSLPEPEPDYSQTEITENLVYDNPDEIAAAFQLEVKHTEDSYECLNCGNQIRDSLEMVKHLMDSHQFEENTAKQHCAQAVILEAQQNQMDNGNNGYNFRDPWTCVHCGKLFTFESNLTKHLEMHDLKIPDQDTDDSMECSDSSLLFVKLTAAGFSCIKCNRGAQEGMKKVAIKQHLRIAHHFDQTKAELQCDEAHKNHRLKQRENFLKCKLCGKVFSKDGLVNHMKIHSIGIGKTENVNQKTLVKARLEKSGPVSQLVKCDLCGRRITHRNHPEHKLRCQGILIIRCELCQRGFLNEKTLQHHNNRRSTKLKCCNCGEEFQEINRLKEHLNDAHNLRTPVMEAEADPPSKTTGTDDQVKIAAPQERIRSPTPHRKRHLRLPCSLCSKIFSSKSDLQKHVNCVHLNIKLFACSHEGCGKRFPLKRSLDLHSRLHTGTANVSSDTAICDMCGKFVKSAYMKYHYKRHLTNGFSASLKYQCPTCNKYMQSPAKLKVHVSRHENQRGFPCTLCKNKSFNTREDLTSHEKYHRKKVEKPVHCAYCDKKFAIKNTYRAHLEATHKFSNEKARAEAGICSTKVSKITGD